MKSRSSGAWKWSDFLSHSPSRGYPRQRPRDQFTDNFTAQWLVDGKGAKTVERVTVQERPLASVAAVIRVKGQTTLWAEMSQFTKAIEDHVVTWDQTWSYNPASFSSRKKWTSDEEERAQRSESTGRSLHVLVAPLWSLSSFAPQSWIICEPTVGVSVSLSTVDPAFTVSGWTAAFWASRRESRACVIPK